MKKNFNSMEEAVEAYLKAEAEDDSESSGDAFCYIFKNSSPEIKNKIREKFKECFPDVNVNPDYYDKDGNPLYSVERVAKELGVTEKEVLERTTWVQ